MTTGKGCLLYDLLSLLTMPDKLEKILMNQQQLIDALNAVKINVDTVNQSLATVTANLSEATTEILAKLEELKNFELDPAVAAIVSDLTTLTNTVIDETANIGTQSKTLADVVPNPEPEPQPEPTQAAERRR